MDVAMRLGHTAGKDGNAFAYLLLDQSALPNFASFWSAIIANPWAPVLGNRAQQPDGGAPLLIDISAIGASIPLQRLILSLGDQAKYANCLSLLQSDSSCAHLAESLRLRAAAELTDRLAVVFRFFDTRTMPLLPRLLTPEQYAAFLACARTWHYVGRDGDVQPLPPAAEHAGAVYESPLVFTAEQERMLIEDGVPDAVIDCLLDQRHPALQGLNPWQQYDRVSGLIDTACRCGLTDVLDSLQYCYAAFEHGDDFAAMAPWADRWADVRSGRISLELALQHG